MYIEVESMFSVGSASFIFVARSGFSSWLSSKVVDFKAGWVNPALSTLFYPDFLRKCLTYFW
jgi:hypothetical protein